MFDELQWYRDELYVYVQIQDQHTRDLCFVHLLIKTVYIKSQNSIYSIVILMIGTSFYFTCIHRMVTFKRTKWRCLIVSLCCRGVKCQLIQVHWRDLFCLLVLLAFSFWNLSCQNLASQESQSFSKHSSRFRQALSNPRWISANRTIASIPSWNHFCMLFKKKKKSKYLSMIASSLYCF